jgi:DNA-binding NarL/FixJ family response regulator
LPPNKPITVALARFDDLLAGGLHELIDGDPSLDLVSAGVEPGRFSVVLQGHQPDVAVLDLNGLGGPAEVRSLCQDHPSTHLVLIANAPSATECAQVLAFGASAYLGRDTQGRDLLNAIHLASRGLLVTSRVLSAEGDGSMQRRRLLTPRETEVLPLLREGASNAEIALALEVGLETVRTHTRSIYRKLGVSSRREISSLPVR